MTNSDRHLDLIAKLLKQAEGTPYEHEADAFMARAQQLATRHSIDLAMARAHTARAEQRDRPIERTVRIGTPGSKGLTQFTRLFLCVAEVNDLRCLIARDSSLVYAYGFDDDITLAETLYASLVVQMSAASERWLRAGHYLSERVWSERQFAHVTPSKAAARIEFHKGFAHRIHERLIEAKERAESAAGAERVGAMTTTAPGAGGPGRELTSMALVLRAKRAEVESAYDQGVRSHRARGSWGGERRQRHGASAQARGAGRRAADSARLTNRREIAG